MVKSQIHAGGRGAGRFNNNPDGAGGIRVVKSVDDVRTNAQEMIGQLIRSFPNLSIASEPVFKPHFNIRLIESLRLHTGGQFIDA